MLLPFDHAELSANCNYWNFVCILRARSVPSCGKARTHANSAASHKVISIDANAAMCKGTSEDGASAGAESPLHRFGVQFWRPVAQGHCTIFTVRFDLKRQLLEQMVHSRNERAEVLEPHGKGGPKLIYGSAAAERILAEARRMPDPQRDWAATWS
jgi:hypothetical protein